MLTEDQITAQNFKSFYNEIRPYLNGQVPAFANQFSRSDLYSTDEKIIGQWINNKPLYQKVLVKIVPQISSTSRQWVELFAQNELPSNIEKGIISAAYWCGDISNLSNMNTYKPFPIVDTSGIFVANVQYNSGVIQVLSNGSSWLTSNSFGVCVVFQYTKTTDTAIKVGTGTDYSTDEQIIGTWIYGKPLYQRTYIGNLTSTTSGQHTVVDASFIPSTHSLKKASGIIKSNETDYTEFTLGSTLGSNGGGFFVGSHSSTGLRITPQGNISWPSGGSYEITVRYTKATD